MPFSPEFHANQQKAPDVTPAEVARQRDAQTRALDRAQREHFSRLIAPLLPLARSQVTLSFGSQKHWKEDIVQQATLNAYRHPEAWPADPDHFRHWFLRIVRNTAHSNLRREKYRSTEPLTIQRLETDSFNNTSANQHAETALSHLKMAEGIAELSQDWQNLLNGFYTEGLTYREIANKYNIPMGTVMSGLHRAKKRLLHILQANDPSFNETQLEASHTSARQHAEKTRATKLAA